jgi:hypothetical protein
MRTNDQSEGPEDFFRKSITQYMYMLRFYIVRCVVLLFYVLMKHIILYA